MSKDVEYRLCWHCNGRLEKTFAVIELYESKLLVHQTCREDAENRLFKNEVNFMGEPIEMGVEKKP